MQRRGGSLSPYRQPPSTPLLARFSLRRPNCLHACNRLPTHELLLRFEEQLFFWVSLLRIVWYPNHTGSPESPLISTHVTEITLSAATELNRQSRNLPGCEFFKKRLFTSYWICCEPQKSFYPTLLLRLLQSKYYKLHFCYYLYSRIMTCETSYRSLFFGNTDVVSFHLQLKRFTGHQVLEELPHPLNWWDMFTLLSL